MAMAGVQCKDGMIKNQEVWTGRLNNPDVKCNVNEVR